MKSFKLSLIALVMSGCFVLCLLGPQSAEAKKFTRCELSKLLQEKFNKSFLSNWICLVQYESNFETAKVGNITSGGFKYGLFQISGKEYCTVGRKGGLCNKKCEDFTNDNIDDDIECATLTFQNEGFKYWSGWKNHCRNFNSLPNLRLLCNM